MSKEPRQRKPKTSRYQQRTWHHEKNRFGTLPYDKLVAPSVGIFDAPTRCYQINHEWASIIMGLVSLLTETRMWQGATDEGFPAIREVQKFLDGGTCGMVDCTEIEDCLNTSAIISAVVAVTYATQEAATQAHIDELAAAYDSTPQSVGSEIPLTAPDQDSLHDNALCRTLELLVSVYANGKGISLDLLNDFGEGYQNMIAATRNLFGYAPEWLLHLLGSELGACAPDVAAAMTALADKSAQLEYACCLYDELRSGVISEAGWNSALTACEGSLTGNAGTIACLMDFDNDQSHALAFFEVYSVLLERQAAGADFVCNCEPDGWFWLDVDWDWEEPTHSGNRSSPDFSHTNPSNGELISVTARFQSDNPGKTGLRAASTGLGDTLVVVTPLKVGQGLRLWENRFVGVFEGADAVGWPAAQRKHTIMSTARRQPGVTFSFKWSDNPDLGHSASTKVSRVRLLYKIVP